MPFPPLCFDCDKMISFDRYQIGVCPECEKERERERASDSWAALRRDVRGHIASGQVATFEELNDILDRMKNLRERNQP